MTKNVNRHINTLADLCTYSSKKFSIMYTGDTLEVYREKDKTLIESVDIRYGANLGKMEPDEIKQKFRELKDKYIFDYDNVLQ